MPDALWITEDYIKTESVISDNVDMKVIMPSIIYAQDIYIHPLLGSQMFKNIQAQINAQAIDAPTITLLNDYIKKTLMYYTIASCTPEFVYRYTNKSISKKNSDNSQPITFEEIDVLIKHFKNKAEVYAERTTRFLRANLSSYPLYYKFVNSDDISPTGENYKSSLFLDDGIRSIYPSNVANPNQIDP